MLNPFHCFAFYVSSFDVQYEPVFIDVNVFGLLWTPWNVVDSMDWTLVVRHGFSFPFGGFWMFLELRFWFCVWTFGFCLN